MNSYLFLVHAALPEVILAIASVLVLAVDLVALRRQPSRLRIGAAAVLGVAGCVAAAYALLQQPIGYDLYHQVFFSNHLVTVVQLAILAVTICVLLFSAANRFAEHAAEFVFLILLATIGMMFLVATYDLLVLFLSLELLSLCLYVLTAFDKSRSRSSESALKYFLFGGMSAAFLLFGFSMLYGATGATGFEAIAQSLHSGLTPFFVIGLACTLIGFGFKIAAAPLHFWAPDAYEGAPASAAAFIASGSKVASFFALFQLLAVAFAPVKGSASWGHIAAGWAPLVALMAVASMLLGNLTALRQTSLRRLIAYSAIAHTGYMLVAIATGTRQALAALLYYVVTYALGTVGIFAISSAIEENDGSDALDDLNGLVRRSPLMAVCLFVFVLSLAGIPPFSGFFAKFYVFVAALQTPGMVWLVAIALLASAVALYYYLQVLKRALVLPVAPHAARFQNRPILVIVILLTAAAVVLFGLMPNLIVSWFDSATAI